MQAIVIKRYGGPEVLAIEERPIPLADEGQVLIRVKAFGVNRAEIHFRQGSWGDVAEISGIECAGVVAADASGRLARGQKVLAIVGGMGRSLNGSYAEYVAVPSANVAAVDTDLAWEDLAALPESYATAWTALVGILGLTHEQTLLVRGATSALGQAAVNIAAQIGAHVIATTRNVERTGSLEAVGAKTVMIEGPDLRARVRERHPDGICAVLDLVGSTTVLDSMAMLRRGGHVCLAGFLGSGGPLQQFEPVFQMPSGRHLSVFASALVTGSREFPLSEIPFQDIVDRAARGFYKARPARVFRFDQIRDAHCLVESGQANGKVVVVV